MTEQTDLDHADPAPQTVYNGQRWTVEIEIILPGDFTPQQIEEGVEYALGGGSIASDHPLVNGDFGRVAAYYARPTGDHYYTDWGAKEPDGSRRGRGRSEMRR